MAASNKQLTDSLANANIVCPLTCGVGPAPAKCNSISDPVAWCKVADEAKFTNGLDALMLESDCKADPCTQADDGATCCEDTSASTSLYGDCTADEATTMMECSTKIQNDTPSEDLADMDKLCGIYQSLNACYPPCYCKDETVSEIMTAQNKQITETLAKQNIECALACGPSLNAANPLTIGFTSVALIVAALFAVL